MRRMRGAGTVLAVLGSVGALAACGAGAGLQSASLAAVTGRAAAAPAARPASAAQPTRVIGDGTPASCTSQAVVAAVAAGGVITFSCGPSPVTILMTATARVINTSARVVLDGGGKVTLSGGGAHRILYMDTCDPHQVWTTPHCQDQSRPRLTVRNLTFLDGNSAGHHFDGGGGGAIFARGGRLRVVNSRFIGNRCDSSGPDLGGAAIRALSEYRGRPVHIIRSTFRGGMCSNGGALSSIGVSWVIRDSRMIQNRAIGNGANPAGPGTAGGGSGGAIYLDGQDDNALIAGTVMDNNSAREGGGAVFDVVDTGWGTLTFNHSHLHNDISGRFQTFPGIYYDIDGRDTVPLMIKSSDS